MRRGGGIRSGGDVDVLRVVLPASSDELGPIRASVREFMTGHDAAPDLVSDFELAVSELATNVIRHTEADTISLVLTRGSTEWVLDVADAERVPPLDSIRLPEPTQTTGRGLFVVMSLMDHVGVTTVDDAQVVRCVREISA